jgi:hypothetical protein
VEAFEASLDAAFQGGEWRELLRGVAALVSALEAPARAAETDAWVEGVAAEWTRCGGGGGGGGDCGGAPHVPPALWRVAPVVLGWGHFKAAQIGAPGDMHAHP